MVCTGIIPVFLPRIPALSRSTNQFINSKGENTVIKIELISDCTIFSGALRSDGFNDVKKCN